MSTIAEKIQRINDTKLGIKQCINSMYCPTNIEFTQYPNMLSTYLNAYDNGDTLIFLSVGQHTQSEYNKKFAIERYGRLNTDLPLSIFWGDGTAVQLTVDITGDADPNHHLIEHEYENDGNYIVKITDNLSGLSFKPKDDLSSKYQNTYNQHITNVISFAKQWSRGMISSYGLRDCYNLQKIKMPYLTNAANIHGDYFLYDCKSLTDVDMPELSTGNTMMFGANPKLSSINVPKLNVINNKYFINDTALSTLAFTDLTRINGKAFIGANALTCLDLSKNKYVVTLNDTDYFVGLNENFIVKVPQAQLTSYLADEKWSASFEHPEQKIIGV